MDGREVRPIVGSEGGGGRGGGARHGSTMQKKKEKWGGREEGKEEGQASRRGKRKRTQTSGGREERGNATVYCSGGSGGEAQLHSYGAGGLALRPCLDGRQKSASDTKTRAGSPPIG